LGEGIGPVAFVNGLTVSANFAAPEVAAEDAGHHEEESGEVDSGDPRGERKWALAGCDHSW
jgi:hypothetical protein